MAEIPPWTAGVLLALIGNIMINLSATLVKYHFIWRQKRTSTMFVALEPDHPTDGAATAAALATGGRRKRFCGCRCTSRYWILGNAMFVVGNLINFASLGFAAQSLIAALGSIQFVTNVLFSYFFLKERVSWMMGYGTCVILLGNALILVFSTHQDFQYDLGSLQALYVETPYIIYMSVSVIILVVSAFGYQVTKRRAIATCARKAAAAAAEAQEATRSTGSTDTMRSTTTTSQQDPKDTFGLVSAEAGNDFYYMAFCYVVVSAIIGTQGVTLAKSLSIIVRAVMKKLERPSTEWEFDPFSFAVLAAWVFCMVFWVIRRANALKCFDASFIVPVLQVCWTILSVVGGGIYFQEFNAFSHTQMAFFTLGVAILVVGVLILAVAKIRMNAEDREAQERAAVDLALAPQLAVNVDAVEITLAAPRRRSVAWDTASVRTDMSSDSKEDLDELAIGSALSMPMDPSCGPTIGQPHEPPTW